MGRKAGAAAILALSILGASAPLSAAAEEPRAAAPVPPSSSEEAAAMEAYGEVRAAFARGEYDRAIEQAGPILKENGHHESVAWVLYMACIAEEGLDHHLSCVDLADRYLREMKERGHAERGYTQAVALARARSLAALGKEKDAEEALGTFLRAYPAVPETRDAEALLAALHSRGACSVEPRYAGKYAAASEFLCGVKIIVEALPAAVDRVRSRLGEPDFPIPDVAVFFRDPEAGSGEAPAGASLHTVASRKVAAIRVSAAALVARRPDFVEMLAGEVFRACVLASDAEGRPAWLLRGLGAWASAAEGVDPVPALSGLAKTPAEAVALMEAALESEDALDGAELRVQAAVGLLLVADLERRSGARAVRVLARQVLSGEGIQEAFAASVVRLPAAVFQDLAARARELAAAKPAAPPK